MAAIYVSGIKGSGYSYSVLSEVQWPYGGRRVDYVARSFGAKVKQQDVVRDADLTISVVDHLVAAAQLVIPTAKQPSPARGSRKINSDARRVSRCRGRRQV